MNPKDYAVIEGIVRNTVDSRDDQKAFPIAVERVRKQFPSMETDAVAECVMGIARDFPCRADRARQDVIAKATTTSELATHLGACLVHVAAFIEGYACVGEDPRPYDRFILAYHPFNEARHELAEIKTAFAKYYAPGFDTVSSHPSFGNRPLGTGVREAVEQAKAIITLAPKGIQVDAHSIEMKTAIGTAVREMYADGSLLLLYGMCAIQTAGYSSAQNEALGTADNPFPSPGHAWNLILNAEATILDSLRVLVPQLEWSLPSA